MSFRFRRSRRFVVFLRCGIRHRACMHSDLVRISWDVALTRFSAICTTVNSYHSPITHAITSTRVPVRPNGLHARTALSLDAHNTKRSLDTLLDSRVHVCTIRKPPACARLRTLARPARRGARSEGSVACWQLRQVCDGGGVWCGMGGRGAAGRAQASRRHRLGSSFEEHKRQKHLAIQSDRVR